MICLLERVEKHFRNLYAPLQYIFARIQLSWRVTTTSPDKISTNCDTHIFSLTTKYLLGVLLCEHQHLFNGQMFEKETVTGIFIVFCMWSNWLLLRKQVFILEEMLFYA